MTQPAKVIGFLDVTGNWDPSLLMVMLGAISTYFVGNKLREHKGRGSAVAMTSSLPCTKRPIDRPLIVGSLIFGLGWGLGGVCPGPAMVSLASGGTDSLLFVASMLLGMFAFQRAQMLARQHLPSRA